MQNGYHQIALDGYSSCGKSTLAKDLAEELGYLHIDSGAMYRAVSLFILDHDIPLQYEQVVACIVNQLDIDFVEQSGMRVTRLDGIVVEDAIREQRISNIVSQVSVIGPVRSRMVELQRNLSRNQHVIMDGRDIGTVVFPEAQVKFFLTADIDIRVERRWMELQANGKLISKEEVQKNLLLRDHIDSNRDIAPLRQAEDAVVIDNTNMDREAQLAFALEVVRERLGVSSV